MRITAVIFIVLAIGANFYFNNLTSLVVAMLSFPLLLVVLLKRKRRKLPLQKKQMASPEERIKTDANTGDHPL